MNQVKSFLTIVGKTPAAAWMIDLFTKVYLHGQKSDSQVSDVQLSLRNEQRKNLSILQYGGTGLVGAQPSGIVHDEVQYSRIGRSSCIKHRWNKPNGSSFKTCIQCGTIAARFDRKH